MISVTLLKEKKELSIVVTTLELAKKFNGLKYLEKFFGSVTNESQ